MSCLKKFLSISILAFHILAILVVPALALTEKEFKRLCRSGSVQALKDTIAREKNFANLRFDDRDTPLIIAADKANNPEFLRVIIAAGVDVNARNEDGETALMELMDDFVNFDCLKVLLDNGADVNIRDEDGETALMKALDEDADANVINALLDAGADVNIKDRKGRDIFHYVRKAHRLAGSDVVKRIEALAK